MSKKHNKQIKFWRNLSEIGLVSEAFVEKETRRIERLYNKHRTKGK